MRSSADPQQLLELASRKDVVVEENSLEGVRWPDIVMGNIKRHKAKQDAKRGKVYTKLIREVTVAAN